jgi:hypothetical protein
LNWTSQYSGTGQGLATSAYGFGRFVTVGMNGTILASTNGIDWVAKPSGVTSLLIGIGAGPDSFVAVGESGYVLQSDTFPPLGIPLNLQLINGTVVLSWSNPTFRLQAAPTVTGVYSNVAGATSPYTNALTGSQEFFRLKWN